MSLKHRTERLVRRAQTRRLAAWEPIIQAVGQAVQGEAARAVEKRRRAWKRLSHQERVEAEKRLPPWGTDKLQADWSRWFADVETVLQTGGVGEGFPGVWPEQLPAVPEEPPGLWEELRGLACGDCEDDSETSGALRCAAAEALLWLAIARGLQNFKAKINVSAGHDSYEVWREG